MAMRRSAVVQFLLSRITVALILTIGILVSSASAKPQSGHDQLEEIQTEHFGFGERGSFTSDASASIQATLSRFRRSEVFKSVLDHRHVTTPGVNALYRLYYEGKTWTEARKTCQMTDGHLAIINSNAELQVIVSVLDGEQKRHRGTTDSNYVLIGFYKPVAAENIYRTIDGRTVEEVGFAEWGQGEPIYTRRCGAVNRDGKLISVSCDDKYAFLCEIPRHDNVPPAGPPGPKGIPGIKGERGSIGMPGSSGLRGVSGMTGTPGAAGPPGPAGLKGDKGNPGRDGDAGPPGPVGSKGGQGYNGLRGSPGPAGLKGERGERGERGTDGLQGVAGEKGPKGDLGPPGLQGFTGPTGPAGPRGEPGLGYHAVCSAVLSILEQIQDPGLIDGGKARTLPGDNATLEQCQEFMTKTYGQDRAGGSSKNPAQRDGRKESPAKTCKDLFLAYPDKPSGEYWIDPNGDDVSDAVLVRCDAERSTTCVAPESSRTSNISYSGYEREFWLSEIDDKLQITYTADANQITALQLLSRHAEQNVTYHCVKSVGYFDSEYQTNERGLKLLAWNDVELGPRGSRQFRYDVISDGCRDRLDEWKETVITYRTNQPARLPVLDVGLRDVGKPGQSFAVEIGEVCFG